MFIRSIIEYGNVAWMGAAPSHLVKLDRIQASAEKIGGFTVETLGSRREAAAVAFALKLLAGKAKGVLKKFIPALEHVKEGTEDVHSSTRSKQYGLIC